MNALFSAGRQCSSSLTCPDFRATRGFLDDHGRQAATNRRLIAQADAREQFRLVESLRQVQANLDRIIPGLETMTGQQGPGDAA